MRYAILSAGHDASIHAKSASCRRSSLLTRRQFEVVWAWASLLALIICWDAAARLDEKVSLPRKVNWQSEQIVESHTDNRSRFLRTH